MSEVSHAKQWNLVFPTQIYNFSLLFVQVELYTGD